MGESQLDLKILVETARRLTEIQRQLLQCLKDKGPGLLLELAVRVLKFPEDVREPLLELQTIGLIETQNVRGTQFGSELYTLTATGDRVLRLLNDPAFQLETQAVARMVGPSAEPTTPTTLNARQQEAELLNKLGDLAKEKGELDEAITFYKQALDITRELSTGGGTQ